MRYIKTFYVKNKTKQNQNKKIWKLTHQITQNKVTVLVTLEIYFII